MIRYIIIITIILTVISSACKSFVVTKNESNYIKLLPCDSLVTNENNSQIISTSEYEGLIIRTDSVSLWKFNIDVKTNSNWTPTKKQIVELERDLNEKISIIGIHKTGISNEDSLKLILRNYFRQYSGQKDLKGEKFILIGLTRKYDIMRNFCRDYFPSYLVDFHFIHSDIAMFDCLKYYPNSKTFVRIYN